MFAFIVNVYVPTSVPTGTLNMCVNSPFVLVFTCPTDTTCPLLSVNLNVMSISVSLVLLLITDPDIVMSSSTVYSVLSSFVLNINSSPSPSRVYPFGFRPVLTVRATFIAYSDPPINICVIFLRRRYINSIVPPHLNKYI